MNRRIGPGLASLLACLVALAPGTARGSCPPPSTAVCPAGTTYGATADQCQASFATCLTGYAYRTSSGQCELSAPATTSSATCPAASSFSPPWGKCETANLGPCPAGSTYDASTGKCELPATFTPAASCPDGYAFDAATARCVGGPSSACVYGGSWGYYEQTCTSGAALPGFSWDDETGQYVGPWACPAGYSVARSSGSCSGPMATASCPDGTTLNTFTSECEAPAAAPCAAGQTYNPSTKLCDFAPMVGADSSCPPGYVLNADAQTCVGGMNSACTMGGSYGYYEHACTSGEPLPGFGWDDETGQYVGPWSCPAGFALNTRYGNCSGAACPSGQVYDTGTGSCQTPAPVAASTLVCSAGSSFSPPWGRCETANLGPCPAGYAYDASTARCEIPATFTPADACPEGYVFDSLECVGPASSACAYGGSWGYYEQTCTSGAALPGFAWDDETGQYVGPWACPAGYSVSRFNGSCHGPMATASCPDGTTLNTFTSKCQAPAAAACAAGQTYNPSTTLCDFPPLVSAVAPTCPAGYVLDVDRQACVGLMNSACTLGGSYGYYEHACTSGEPLPGFGWDDETGQYVGPWSCPTGFGLNTRYGNCSGASCPSGQAFDAATSACRPSGCPAGTVKSGSLCVAAAVCR